MTEEAPIKRERGGDEVEERSAFWAKSFAPSYRIVAFLWKGDTKATPFQRSALILFGLISFCCTFYMILAITDGSNPLDKRIVGAIALLIPFLVSMRLFRNALLRSKNPPEKDRDAQSERVIRSRAMILSGANA